MFWNEKGENVKKFISTVIQLAVTGLGLSCSYFLPREDLIFAFPPAMLGVWFGTGLLTLRITDRFGVPRSAGSGAIGLLYLWVILRAVFLLLFFLFGALQILFYGTAVLAMTISIFVADTFFFLGLKY